MKCALVAADGVVVHRETRPTPREAGGRPVLDALLETVVEIGQKATADGHQVRAIGVVVPGVIDAASGTVSAENLAWVGTPVLAELTTAVGGDVPIVLAHDVRAGGYAELRQGALVGTTNSMFLPLGTGIAAAMVIDGTPASSAIRSSSTAMPPSAAPAVNGAASKRSPPPPHSPGGTAHALDGPWTAHGKCWSCSRRGIRMPHRSGTMR
jgi:predicted NBD/HSP70 family sugar kinase